MAEPAVNQFYRRASFLISAARPAQFPKGAGLEVAFAGRSNAGKSSAINTLCGTRLINFFALDEQRRLVDLPGYGYAKVPEKMKLEWQQLMEAYLQQRKALRGLVIIMDIRHPLKEFDWQMLDWCHYYQLPAHILLTKADKLKRGAQQKHLLMVRRQLVASGIDASVQVFSALNQVGLEELVAKLNEWLELDRQFDAGQV